MGMVGFHNRVFLIRPWRAAVGWATTRVVSERPPRSTPLDQGFRTGVTTGRAGAVTSGSPCATCTPARNKALRFADPRCNPDAEFESKRPSAGARFASFNARFPSTTPAASGERSARSPMNHPAVEIRRRSFQGHIAWRATQCRTRQNSPRPGTFKTCWRAWGFTKIGAWIQGRSTRGAAGMVPIGFARPNGAASGRFSSSNSSR